MSGPYTFASTSKKHRSHPLLPNLIRVHLQKNIYRIHCFLILSASAVSSWWTRNKKEAKQFTSLLMVAFKLMFRIRGRRLRTILLESEPKAGNKKGIKQVSNEAIIVTIYQLSYSFPSENAPQFVMTGKSRSPQSVAFFMKCGHLLPSPSTNSQW